MARTKNTEVDLHAKGTVGLEGDQARDNARKERENKLLKVDPLVKEAVDKIDEQPWLKVIDQRPNLSGTVDTQILREAVTTKDQGPRVMVEAVRRGYNVGTVTNRVRGQRCIVTCPCGARPTTSDDDESPCEVCGKAVVRITA